MFARLQYSNWTGQCSEEKLDRPNSNGHQFHIVKDFKTFSTGIEIVRSSECKIYLRLLERMVTVLMEKGGRAVIKINYTKIKEYICFFCEYNVIFLR